MANNSTPPAAPAIGAEDRATIRHTIEERLASMKMSFRELERRMGRPSGTLSKVFKGRLRLTHPMLGEICQVLGVDPVVLVEGTGYAHLLSTAPPSPAFVALEEARAEIDRLKLELAAAQARMAELERERDAAKKQADQQRTVADKCARTIAEREAELAKAKDLVRSLSATSEQFRRAVAVANDKIGALASANATRAAQEEEARKLMDGWRRYALDRASRVAQLETHLKSQQGEAALLGSLLGLGLGIVASNRS